MIASNRLTVLHIFSGDLWAGAERMICALLSQMVSYSDLRVIALALNEGHLTVALRRNGIETYVLEESRYAFHGLIAKGVSLLEGQRIHVIHAHRYKENCLAFVLRWLLSADMSISTVHGLPEINGLPFSLSLRTRMQDGLNRFLLRHGFARTVAVSGDIKNALTRRYGFPPESVDVIHNGIDLPDLSESGSSLDRPFRIGTVGRLVPVKDYGLFVRVAKLLVESGEAVEFYILGDGPMKAVLQQEVYRLGLDGKVHLLEPRPDPTDFYQSLDLYLNTSVHEGVPLALLEAMACGKAIVAPSVGGIPEFLVDGEHGFLIEKRETEEFASKCRVLIHNRELLTILGKKARAHVERSYTSRRMAEAYVDLYRQVAGAALSEEMF